MTARGTDSIAGAAMEYKTATRTKTDRRKVISLYGGDAESADTLADCKIVGQTAADVARRVENSAKDGNDDRHPEHPLHEDGPLIIRPADAGTRI